MNITKGLKQGDPLSPYLFLLSIEPFSIAIRQSKIIKGINIYDENYKLSQFADDTTILCEHYKELDEIARMLDEFYLISGYRNNHDKTAIIGI